MDIILWTYWIYLMMDLPLFDDVCVLVWRVVSWGGYRVMWCVVLLCWPRSTVGWVHWPTAHPSISPVVVELPCKMTPNSSFSFPYCMFFRKCMVCSGFPYSCLLLRLCNAYAKIGLLFFIHLICSRRLISISLPFWPTYDLLHVLHCNICMPLEFILFSGILSHNWLYIVLHVLNIMFKSVFFNKLVTLCVCGLKYENVIHFFSCVCVLSVFCV